MKGKCALGLLLLATREGFSFCPTPFSPRQPAVTRFAKKKGFGNDPPPKKKNVAPTGAEGAVMKAETATQETPAPQMNEGQKALAELRRQRTASKDAELRKVREMLDADQQVQESAPAIPERVAQRMGKRMLPFVGIPLFLGMGTFVGFWYMATYRDMEFQPALVAASTILVLFIGLVGITYSVMSASWDEDREGDLFGTQEFSRNIQNIKDGLSRSRDNAVLREKMSGLADGELDRAMSDLERREASQQRKAQSLGEKLSEDME